MITTTRGTYGEVTNSEIVASGRKVIAHAVKLGKLPKEYIETDSKKRGSCLNYDVYDRLGGTYLIQRRDTTLDKYGAHPIKSYYLLRRIGGGIAITEVANKAKANRAAKLAVRLGDAIRTLNGETDLSTLAKTHAAKVAKAKIAAEKAARTKTGSLIAGWQAQGLLPEIDGDVIVWKHVTVDGYQDETITGNRGFRYRIDVPFALTTNQAENFSMACAGPMGALKDWSGGRSNAYVLAIRTPRKAVQIRKDGAFMFTTGTPIALYSATNIDGESCDLRLIQGIDALKMIE